ncbi:polysaccharide pyruvyl transferase family protein [Brevibacterium salitolerans]|uniref:Polysaccharide pyruvyl transferase domain-containing protein n=1 Tax=Brevibacterium salitolerans TaxID=1403566 RepID=A0ABN2X631_9MICO
MLLADGSIPMRWWGYERNFGDLLGPWLVSRMTDKPIRWVPSYEPHYLTIGSIVGHATPASVLWGTGSFGTEAKSEMAPGARYLAVRGPLTRARLEMFKQPCPKVYGDPALLVARYYPRTIEPSYELGVVLRWSETARKKSFDVEGVKLIELKTDDVEGTLDDMLACKRIISTSLHGLILADAYGIPNSWLIADTGWGKEYKFWDYLTSVRKEREPDDFDIVDQGMTIDQLIERSAFDARDIQLDLDMLYAANPFTGESETISAAEELAIQGSRDMKEGGEVNYSSAVPRYAK